MEVPFELNEELMYEGHDDLAVVTDETIEGTGRWSTYFSIVVMHKPTQTYWRLSWSRGSTEYQDNGVEDLTATQVVPKEVTVTQYVVA